MKEVADYKLQTCKEIKMNVYIHIERSKKDSKYCFWWYDEKLRRELIMKGYKVGKAEYGLASTGLSNTKIMKIRWG